MKLRSFALILLLATACTAAAVEPAELKLTVGEGQKLKVDGASAPQWVCTDPAVAAVYANGFVVALKPGQAAVKLGDDVCRVRVTTEDDRVRPLSSIQQFKDNREFVANGRKCVGS